MEFENAVLEKRGVGAESGSGLLHKEEQNAFCDPLSVGKCKD